jgi:hypothetical protein
MSFLPVCQDVDGRESPAMTLMGLGINPGTP